MCFSSEYRFTQETTTPQRQILQIEIAKSLFAPLSSFAFSSYKHVLYIGSKKVNKEGRRSTSLGANHGQGTMLSILT